MLTIITTSRKLVPHRGWSVENFFAFSTFRFRGLRSCKPSCVRRRGTRTHVSCPSSRKLMRRKITKAATRKNAVDSIEERWSSRIRAGFEEARHEQRQGDEQHDIHAERQDEIAGDQPGGNFSGFALCLRLFSALSVLEASHLLVQHCFFGREPQRLDPQDQSLSEYADAAEDRQLEDLPSSRRRSCRASFMTRTVPSCRRTATE